MMIPWEREVYLTMLIEHMRKEEEKAKELEFVRQMYGMAANAEAAI